LAYQALDEETALKSYDFSSGALARCRAAGSADMAGAIARWRACGCDQPSLTVHGPRLEQSRTMELQDRPGRECLRACG
jgi:hypothetical protein